jgi:hypothetical protein
LNTSLAIMLGLIYGVWGHFQQYFSYIVAVSFIAGGNRSAINGRENLKGQSRIDNPEPLRSVLLVEETGVPRENHRPDANKLKVAIHKKYFCGQFYCWRKPECLGENHRPVASHWQTLSHSVAPSTHHLSGIGIHNFSGDRYWMHTITSTTTPLRRSSKGSGFLQQ